MHIVKAEALNAACEAVLRLEACMMSGKVEPDQVKILLCSTLDIWPDSIFGPDGEEIAGDQTPMSMSIGLSQ